MTVEEYPGFKSFEFNVTIQVPAKDIEEARIKIHQLMCLISLPYNIREEDSESENEQ